MAAKKTTTRTTTTKQPTRATPPKSNRQLQARSDAAYEALSSAEQQRIAKQYPQGKLRDQAVIDAVDRKKPAAKKALSAKYSTTAKTRKPRAN